MWQPGWGRGFGAEWIHVWKWLSPFTVHRKPSHHCLLIGRTQESRLTWAAGRRCLPLWSSPSLCDTACLMIRGAGGPACEQQRRTQPSEGGTDRWMPISVLPAQTKQMMNNGALPQFQSSRRNASIRYNQSLLGWARSSLLCVKEKDNRRKL